MTARLSESTELSATVQNVTAARSIVAHLRRERILSREDAELLLSFLTPAQGHASALLAQVRAGVHTNPRVRGSLMSRDVLGIVYVHVDDGELYAHAFGRDVVVDTKLRNGVLFHIVNPPPHSGVKMRAEGESTVTLSGAALTSEY